MKLHLVNAMLYSQASQEIMRSGGCRVPKTVMGRECTVTRTNLLKPSCKQREVTAFVLSYTNKVRKELSRHLLLLAKTSNYILSNNDIIIKPKFSDSNQLHYTKLSKINKLLFNRFRPKRTRLTHDKSTAQLSI